MVKLNQFYAQNICGDFFLQIVKKGYIQILGYFWKTEVHIWYERF